MANMTSVMQELDYIYQLLEENEGELTENLEARLSISKEDFGNKLDGYHLYVKRLESEKKMFKDEIATFNNKINTLSAKQDHLKEVMKMAVMHFGTQKDNGEYGYKSNNYSFWTHVSKSLDIDEDVFAEKDYISYNFESKKLSLEEKQKIHELFVEQNLTYTASEVFDKVGIKKALSNGLEIEGAELIEKRGVRAR